MKDEKRTNLTQDPQRSKLTEADSLEKAVDKAVSEPEKRVAVKILRDVKVDGKLTKAGKTVNVTEEQAEQLCKPIPGHYAGVGSMDTGEEQTPVPIFRAQRVDAVA